MGKIAVSSWLLLGLCVAAQAVPLTNGSFETGNFSSWQPGPGMGDPNNPWSTWGRFVVSVAPPNPVYQPAPPNVSAADGRYFAALHHDNFSNSTHSFYQDFDLTAGDTVLKFMLNVDLNPENPYGQGQGAWAWANIEERRPGGSVFRLVSFGGTQNGTHYGTNGWQPYQFDVSHYTQQTQLRIRFSLQTGNNQVIAHQRLFADNVALVPEPATLALFAVGVCALVRRVPASPRRRVG